MNDSILIPLVVGLLAIWFLTGLAEKGYKWWKGRAKRAALKSIEKYEVPTDYNQVGLIQEDVNKRQLDATEAGQVVSATALEGKISQVRQKVSRIRYGGYVFGEEAKLNRVDFDIGVEQHKYEKGSGEAKQWVRGYCMAFGVQPKKWMDKA